VSLHDRVDAEVKSQAQGQADLVAASASELLEHRRRGGLNALVDASAGHVRGRVLIVGRRGRLLADSAGAAPGSAYGDRPEVKAALRGRSEQITRDSASLGEQILATAVPVINHARPVGAVRITQSVAAVDRAVRTAILDLALLAGVVLAVGLLAGALIARQIARPIRHLDSAARRVAAGDLETTVGVEGSSEQRSLARAFNEMTGRLHRLLRGQQDFVADASHQLRTPLTALRLRLENLDDSIGEDEDIAVEVRAGMDEVDRLSRMVDELLILSRAGERELPGAPIDLASAARRAVERWREAARERGIELDVEGEPCPPVWCAAADLDRTIDALLENALAYSPSGSSVRLVYASGRLEIRDEGPGLEPGEEEAVFERFRRGSAGRNVPGGTGLGLPIARELAREWSGEVTIASRPEGGAATAILLPLAATAPQAAPSRQPAVDPSRRAR
jgi:signal transduction histidine kinase